MRIEKWQMRVTPAVMVARVQVKVLRLLQYYPPPEREEVNKRLCEV